MLMNNDDDDVDDDDNNDDDNHDDVGDDDDNDDDVDVDGAKAEESARLPRCRDHLPAVSQSLTDYPPLIASIPDDHDDDDIYIMMECLSVCVSRKMITSSWESPVTT